MRVLLDTCALLWLVGDPTQLSTKARTMLVDGETELCISAISAFEIAVKHKKGKLTLPLPAPEWLRTALVTYAIETLPITAEITAMAPEVAVRTRTPAIG